MAPALAAAFAAIKMITSSAAVRDAHEALVTALVTWDVRRTIVFMMIVTPY